MSLRPFGGRGFYDPYHEMNRLLDEMMGGTVGPARKSGRQQGAATEWANLAIKSGTHKWNWRGGKSG